MRAMQMWRKMMPYCRILSSSSLHRLFECSFSIYLTKSPTFNMYTLQKIDPSSCINFMCSLSPASSIVFTRRPFELISERILSIISLSTQQTLQPSICILYRKLIFFHFFRDGIHVYTLKFRLKDFFF